MVCPVYQPQDVSLSPQANPIFALAAILNARTGYRSYSPELGRWVNRDPIGEKGGSNIYAFVDNRVFERIDYLGLQSTSQDRYQGKENRFSDCTVHLIVGHITDVGKENTIKQIVAEWEAYSKSYSGSKRAHTRLGVFTCFSAGMGWGNDEDSIYSRLGGPANKFLLPGRINKRGEDTKPGEFPWTMKPNDFMWLREDPFDAFREEGDKIGWIYWQLGPELLQARKTVQSALHTMADEPFKEKCCPKVKLVIEYIYRDNFDPELAVALNAAFNARMIREEGKGVAKFEKTMARTTGVNRYFRGLPGASQRYRIIRPNEQYPTRPIPYADIR